MSERLAWPRQAGHDVHTYYLMQALARTGHEVHLTTVQEQDPRAVKGAELSTIHRLTGAGFCDEPNSLPLSKLQDRFRNYWGIRPAIIHELAAHAKDIAADAVIVVGLHVLPYLASIKSSQRIWYAGDEWAWHHWSQMQWLRPSTWKEAKQSLIKGLYERCYRNLIDRVWMVSEADCRAWRLVTGHRGVDCIPNGVDSEHYQIGNELEQEQTCVFWGRLDFGPNIQALQWFCKRVWSRIRISNRNAVFRIYGFQPTAEILALAKPDSGVEIYANLPDIRNEIRRQAVVVLPFQSGGGIKNKLLEAAALGKAIVCTPRTVQGLNAGTSVIQCDRSAEWIRTIQELWKDDTRRKRLGETARNWVLREHTWRAAAQSATESLQSNQQQSITPSICTI